MVQPFGVILRILVTGNQEFPILSQRNIPKLFRSLFAERKSICCVCIFTQASFENSPFCPSHAPRAAPLLFGSKQPPEQYG